MGRVCVARRKSSKTLAGKRSGPEATDWLIEFSGQEQATSVAKVVKIFEKCMILISAHEADTLIGASTRLGGIGDLPLQAKRTLIASRDSDYLMMIGSAEARYRLIPSTKHHVTRMVDLGLLDGLLLGCDSLRAGVKGIGPASLVKLPRVGLQLSTWTNGYHQATRMLQLDPSTTEPKLAQNIRDICDTINSIRELYHFFRGDLFLKEPNVPVVEYSSRVLFENTSFDGQRHSHRQFDNAQDRRKTPLLQGPRFQVQKLSPVPALANIGDQRLRHAAAAVRRVEARQPARSTSTRKLAIEGAIKAQRYQLLTPEHKLVECASKRSGKPKEKPQAASELKATTAKQLSRSLFTSDAPKPTGDDYKAFPGADVYKMCTMSSAFEDMVRETDGEGPALAIETKKRRRIRKQMARRKKKTRTQGWQQDSNQANDRMSID
ncbi:BQ2448_147 [Microbotryum intermedium]|uniref:BQ2448_147 protein n=1 Tax=Microbotryum intermedium TaxID=269621 RepID=A0A238FAB2_9BASI|nr:BQ2448_147 [Microbotryum intermedium]